MTQQEQRPNYFVMPFLKWRKEPDPEYIIRQVCSYYQIEETSVKGKKRDRELVFARHLCMYLIRKKIPSLSLKKIGNFFGARDHTTVLHAITCIENYIETDSLGKKEEILNFY
jgi:chromosomal replication initiator protein